MGTDIYSFAEKKVDGEWEVIGDLEPFGDRCYSTFAFLAGMRNHSNITPIAEPRGLPGDLSPGGHMVAGGAKDPDDDKYYYFEGICASWLSVEELSNYDYLQEFTDIRCDPPLRRSMRDFLGGYFFEELSKLEAIGAERIVFWFD